MTYRRLIVARGMAMGEWFEDESFWSDFYPFMFAEERLRLGADEVAQALALAGLTAPAGKAALDLCCGPGRHAVPLAQRGLRVTGVDRTALLLDRARERARLAGVDVELVQSDMREFRRPAAYDLALSLFTSFGYFAAPEDDLLVLRNVRESLRPGGVLVMDMMGKECLARIFQPTRSRTLADGRVLVERCEVVDDWTADRQRMAAGPRGSGSRGAVPPAGVLGTGAPGPATARRGSRRSRSTEGWTAPLRSRRRAAGRGRPRRR